MTGVSARSGRLAARAVVVTALVVGALAAVGGSASAAAALQITMSVNKSVATPGDLLAYTIVVTNAGDTTLNDIQVTSHIPLQTTLGPQPCPSGTSSCTTANVAEPGQGNAVHQISVGRLGTFNPGDTFTYAFTVTIDSGATIGSSITNHAHVESPVLVPLVTSGPVSTLVEAAPALRGVFGGTALSISGSKTDSYDSSTGPYDPIKAGSAGNVASNADIVISGGSVVRGNATPGPGHQVQLSGASQVTGSTAPAIAMALAPAQDATPYASSNDDSTICSAPGSCSNTTFTPSTGTLNVSGSATLAQGTYYLCELLVTGSLRVTGTVNVWVGAPQACGGRGDIRFDSGSSVSISSARTKDFEIHMQGSPNASTTAVVSSSAASFTGVILAPQTDLTIQGGAALLGGAIAQTATISSSTVHVDSSL